MKRKLFLALSVFAVFVALPLGLFAAEEEEKVEEEKVLVDKKYKVVSTRDDEEVGTRHLKAVEKDGEIHITEVATFKYHGATVGLNATQVYKADGDYDFLSASGKTFIGNNVAMDGSITFHDNGADISVKGFIDRRGNKCDEPLKLDKKNMEIPKGRLFSRVALEVFGPKLLANEGELKNIVSVEFPDDIKYPEFINFKENYVIKREATKEDGSFKMKLIDKSGQRGGSDRVVCAYVFDKDGNCVPGDMYKMKFVPITDKEDDSPKKENEAEKEEEKEEKKEEKKEGE
jgi:hypothetical protein